MRPAGLPLLLAALFVPTAALAVAGTRLFGAELERARETQEGGARTAVATAREALLAEAEGASPGAFVVELDDAGAPRVAELASPWGAEPFVEDALDGFFATELALAEREGGAEAALARLDGFASDSIEAASDSIEAASAAWVQESRAVLLDRAGDSAGALEQLAELERAHPDARDARGLRRVSALRVVLAESGEELAVAYEELVADHATSDQVAVEALKRLVRERLDERALPEAVRARVDAAAATDARRELARRLLDTGGGRLAAWLAGARPGAATRVEVGGRAIGLFALADGRARAGALDELARRALARPELASLGELGFAVRVGDPAASWSSTTSADSSELPAAPHASDDVAGLDLHIDGYALDLERLVRGERRRLITWAIALGLVVLLSGGAAFLSARAIRREEALAREREGFVAAVTHELKTPLASIRLLAEVLERGGVEDAKVREFAQRTTTEADRLTRLVDGVLDLARLERSTDAAELRRQLPANELAERARESFAPVAEDLGFGVRVRPDANDPVVSVEPDAVHGALLGLLENAAKYSDEPHEIEVEVAMVDDARVSLAVLDRGRGVPREDAERVFEPFRRVGDELVRDRPGAGIGLALVSRVAAAHGGTARCAPRDGGGSRFEIVLPLARGGAA